MASGSACGPAIWKCSWTTAAGTGIRTAGGGTSTGAIVIGIVGRSTAGSEASARAIGIEVVGRSTAGSGTSAGATDIGIVSRSTAGSGASAGAIGIEVVGRSTAGSGAIAGATGIGIVGRSTAGSRASAEATGIGVVSRSTAGSGASAGATSGIVGRSTAGSEASAGATSIGIVGRSTGGGRASAGARIGQVDWTTIPGRPIGIGIVGRSTAGADTEKGCHPSADCGGIVTDKGREVTHALLADGADVLQLSVGRIVIDGVVDAFEVVDCDANFSDSFECPVIVSDVNKCLVQSWDEYKLSAQGITVSDDVAVCISEDSWVRFDEEESANEVEGSKVFIDVNACSLDIKVADDFFDDMVDVKKIRVDDKEVGQTTLLDDLQICIFVS